MLRSINILIKFVAYRIMKIRVRNFYELSKKLFSKNYCKINYSAYTFKLIEWFFR